MSGIEKSIDTNITDMIHYAANTIHYDIYAINRDFYEGYQWIACLDSKTCIVCGDLDNKIFDLLPKMEGEGTRPPERTHSGCRCIMCPVLIGMGKENQQGPNYQDWLSRQDMKTQVDILGPAKYKLYHDGKPLGGFVRYSVEENRVMSLKELGVSRVSRKKLYADKPPGQAGHWPPDAQEPAADGKSPSKNEQNGGGATNIAAINAEMTDLMQRGKKTGKERATITLEGGKRLSSLNGDKDSVKLSPAFIKKLDSQAGNSVICMHNHPDTTSFSRADLDFMCRHTSIKEMRVVGSKGKTYFMSVGSGERPSYEAIISYEKEIESDLKRECANRLVRREIPKGETTWSLYLSERNRAFAKKFGWEYKEGKLDG
jgi:hypothetical protein